VQGSGASTAAQDTVAAAVGRFEAAGLKAKQQPAGSAAAQQETAAAPAKSEQQKVEPVAAQETKLESVSKEVGHTFATKKPSNTAPHLFPLSPQDSATATGADVLLLHRHGRQLAATDGSQDAQP
jgi:hypothetical protein